MSKLQNFLDKQIQAAVDMERLRNDVQKRMRSSSTNRLLASLSCQRRNLEGQLERLLEDLVNGVLDKEDYTQLKVCYLDKLSALKAQETEIKTDCEAQAEKLEQLEAWLAALQDYQKTSVIDRRLVDALVDKVLVFQDRSIRLCLTYGDPCKLLSTLEAERGERCVS